MAILDVEKIKADGARFRALGPDAMADRLFGILGHQCFQLGFGPLMVQEGLPSAAE